MMSRRQASSATWRSVVVFVGMFVGAFAPAGACHDVMSIARLRPDAPNFTNSSGIDAAGQFVGRNAADWTALWQRVHSRRRPTPPLPEVDFEREMMVVVAAGQHRTGGHSIRIDRAWREGAKTIIVVHEEAPGPGCIVASAITSAVDIARLPVAPEPIEFRVESEIRDCG